MKTVKVEDAPPYTRARYQATLTDWDWGIPIGYGNTIQEALESFLDQYDEPINYKWS